MNTLDLATANIWPKYTGEMITVFNTFSGESEVKQVVQCDLRPDLKDFFFGPDISVSDLYLLDAPYTEIDLIRPFQDYIKTDRGYVKADVHEYDIVIDSDGPNPKPMGSLTIYGSTGYSIPGIIYDTLYVYPRDEEPTLDKLCQYTWPSSESIVDWTIREINQYNLADGSDGCTIREHYRVTSTSIFRNGEMFCIFRGPEATLRATHALLNLRHHPLNLDSIGFDTKMIGRHVKYAGVPATITEYKKRLASIVLTPDEGFTFKDIYNDVDYIQDLMIVSLYEASPIQWYV